MSSPEGAPHWMHADSGGTMARRALRQHYDDHPVPVEIDPAVGSPIEPWRRHRRRLLASLEALDDRSWSAPSRCDGWSAQDVASHLATADGFWAFSLAQGLSGSPTDVLRGFDPVASPASLVEPTRAQAPAEVLDAFRSANRAFEAVVDGLDDAALDTICEAPPGHAPARLVLAHALWDSWLHERDILVPLGAPPPVEADELAVATWYAMTLGAVEGGLLDDPEPVGPGLTEAFDVTVAFDDLPGSALHLRVDRTVRLSPGDPAEATTVGAALDFVERATGRGEPGVDPRVPAPLAAQLERAFAILVPADDTAPA